MPRLSAFYGIVITMYYDEDHQVPHFHARYAGHNASYAIDGCRHLAGRFPDRAQRLVRAWALLHTAELHQAWNRARAEQPLGTIEPLP